jgi:hypothetical protein
MGSEDLFHKRKARETGAVQRKKVERALNRRYLIVSEGTKTEPNYFAELLRDWRISPQLVCNRPSSDGSSPDKVVECAQRLYEEDKVHGDAYDAVYCVFDRDSHKSFKPAQAKIKALDKKGVPIHGIISNPCFEVWLLLHFECSTQPFHAAGKKSIGDQVVAKLKTMPGFEKYDKGQKNVFALLADKLEQALLHAPRLRQHCEATQSTNPVTDVDRLVKALQALRTVRR